MSEQSNFYHLVDSCKAKAILGKLSPTESDEWRYLCRFYSKTFCTPLDQVLSMDPEIIVLAFFEEQMDLFNKEEHIEKILEMIYELEDPDYAKKKREAEEDFDKELERVEAERLSKGVSIQKAMKNMVGFLKNTFVKPVKEQENLPTEGSLKDLFDPNKEG